MQAFGLGLQLLVELSGIHAASAFTPATIAPPLPPVLIDNIRTAY